MIWLILGLGLALRFFSLSQSLWLDEAINVMAAKSFSFFGMMTQYAVADFHPPGWFAILWIWGKIFGYSEISMRIPSVIFGIITIYIAYLLGKNLLSKNLGLLSALLLAINPLHIYYSQEARMYALTVLAVAVNMLLFIKIIQRKNINLVFVILSNIAVLLSDYGAYFVFPAQFLYLLFWKKEFIKKWFIAQGISLISFVPWLPVFLRQLDVGASASANLPTWKFVAGSFDFKTIPLTYVKFIIGRISLANKFVYGAIVFPIGILFAFILLRGIRKILLLWMLVPILIATLISIYVPVYSYFRVLYIIPAFLISISLGILSLKGKLKLAALFGVIFTEIIASLIYLTNSTYQREDWRGLVKFFDSINPEVVLFESSGTFPPFDYYSKEYLNARGALKDFPAKSDEDVIDLQSYKEIYLVNYLVEISDPKRLVEKNIKSLGFKEENVKDFHGVGFVYHYVK